MAVSGRDPAQIATDSPLVGVKLTRHHCIVDLLVALESQSGCENVILLSRDQAKRVPCFPRNIQPTPDIEQYRNLVDTGIPKAARG